MIVFRVLGILFKIQDFPLFFTKKMGNFFQTLFFGGAVQLVSILHEYLYCNVFVKN